MVKYMTLVAAWFKRNASGEELYVASDSRLNCGRAWYIEAKVLDLGREDSATAFAGVTENAYPDVATSNCDENVFKDPYYCEGICSFLRIQIIHH